MHSEEMLRNLRNNIPIDMVIVSLLKMEARKTEELLRFRCPVCNNFHTATNHKTNLARCFDCKKNFNPIDLVIRVGNVSFPKAVEFLKDHIE